MQDKRSHYIPSFTRRATTVIQSDGEGHLQAVCGAWTTPEQHKVDPAELTCWGCKAWIENLNLIEKES
jgi:hypothetical protein